MKISTIFLHSFIKNKSQHKFFIPSGMWDLSPEYRQQCFTVKLERRNCCKYRVGQNYNHQNSKCRHLNSFQYIFLSNWLSFYKFIMTTRCLPPLLLAKGQKVGGWGEGCKLSPGTVDRQKFIDIDDQNDKNRRKNPSIFF